MKGLVDASLRKKCLAGIKFGTVAKKMDHAKSRDQVPVVVERLNKSFLKKIQI
jgi:hypothetical protein